MKKYLSKLSYKTNGYRTFDIVLKRVKGIIDISLIISIVVLTITFLCVIFKWDFNFLIYLIVIFLMILNIAVALYFAKWHSFLTTRQRYVLFKQFDSFDRKSRIEEIKKYLVKGYIAAIISAMTIFFFTVNNFLLANVNSLYVLADSNIKYNSTKLSYHTLKTFLFGGQLYNTFLLVFPILLMVYILYNTYSNELKLYSDFFEQWAGSRSFKNKSIDKLVQDRETRGLANILVGVDAKTDSDVVMNAYTLVLNTVFLGSVGTGKSSAVAKPFIARHIDNMVHYMRQFSSFVLKQKASVEKLNLSEDEQKLAEEEAINEWFKRGLGKNMTSGIYVNEPSGDLARDTIKALKRTGFPDDFIWQIDPEDAYTDAINILDTDMELAAALFADIIRRFSEGDGGGNEFFISAQEAHARYIVILLKSTAAVTDAPINKKLNGNAPTFTELNELLRNDEFIYARLLILKNIIKSNKRVFQKVNDKFIKLYNQEKKQWTQNGNSERIFNANISLELKKLKVENDELYSKLEILKETFDYFISNQTLLNTGELSFKFDKNIEGLKSIMRRLSADSRVHRIFFSQSTKNIDIVLKYGGAIVVNTAKASLGEANSKMVGQVAETVLQNAAFRRTENISPLFPMIVDEANAILMAQTQNFLAQSRKYRMPILHLYQNVEQAIATIGDKQTKALFESYRNSFIFQEGSADSTEYIAGRGVDKLVIEKGVRAEVENVIAGHDSNSRSVSETFVEKPVLTKSDVNRLESFQYAGVMVIDNEVSDLTTINALPSFKMPIFNEKIEFKAPFDVEKNKTDKLIYDTWKEEVNKAYVNLSKSFSLTKKDFLPTEWADIMTVKEPEISENNNLEDEGNKINLSYSDSNSEGEKRDNIAQSILNDKNNIVVDEKQILEVSDERNIKKSFDSENDTTLNFDDYNSEIDSAIKDFNEEFQLPMPSNEEYNEENNVKNKEIDNIKNLSKPLNEKYIIGNETKSVSVQNLVPASPDDDDKVVL